MFLDDPDATLSLSLLSALGDLWWTAMVGFSPACVNVQHISTMFEDIFTIDSKFKINYEKKLCFVNSGYQN